MHLVVLPLGHLGSFDVSGLTRMLVSCNLQNATQSNQTEAAVAAHSPS